MIYLLHFETPFKHARHYIGFVESPEALQSRMDKHKGGSGSKLMRAVSKAGIVFSIARLWPGGDRNFERKLKRRKETPMLCPICNPKAMGLATEISSGIREMYANIQEI